MKSIIVWLPRLVSGVCRWDGFESLVESQDLDDWENKRVKRLPGENDGV